MSFLGKAKKVDLVVLATELGEEIPVNAKIIDLKTLITKSPNYEEAYVKELVSTIIEDRIEQEKAEADAQKLALERTFEREKAEADAQKLALERTFEREKADAEREHELKLRKLESENIQAKSQTEVPVTSSESERDKIGNSFLGYLKAMKGVIYDPPDRAEEWPFFFHHAEKMFKLFEVPEQFQGKIILNCLRGYAKGLNAMLDDEDFDKYEKIKYFVLKEQRITPLHYKKNFDLCFKTHNETYSQYASRVQSALELYLKSRNVTTIETLKELIIVDKIKDTLPAHAKSHIYLKETENWLSVCDLVQEVDNFLISVPKNPSNYYYNNKENTFHYGSKSYDSAKKKIYYTSDPKMKNNFSEGRESAAQNKKIGKQSTEMVSKKLLKCYKCQEEGHIKRFCPKGNSVAQISKADRNDSGEKGLNEVCIRMSNASFDSETPVNEAEGELLRIDLGVGCHKFQGIVDSGAEITVLRKSIVPEELLESSGKIFLRPAVGPTVEAKLVTIPLSLWTEEEDIKPWVQVHAAVVEGLHEEALVTPRVFQLLKEQKTKYLGEESEIMSVEESLEERVFNLEGRSSADKLRVSQEPIDLENSEAVTTPVETNTLPKEISRVDNSEDKISTESQVQKLRKEQLACPTLQDCWTDAKRQKNNYWVESDLLYHTSKVGGQKYVQLVVPECRRKDILKLAHETPTGGHLAAKKTRDRIAMSFWWEGLSRDVKTLCESCHDCQLRRKTKVRDRAPIEAVGRPELPFQVVNADILGPIEPKSSRGHQYVLCVIDQHSRWPEAIPIKSLTAKTTCDAFMEIFMRTGIPRIIAMDNGTNFAAKLTQELLKRLGVVPKFSTPGYPQSNGLVERWIGTMKSMLHHAISSQGRGWDKQLPYLLWAYREVPNATTGVSPFLLVHGRSPVGPLAILKSSWEEEILLPQGIGESVTDYLHQLRKRLEDAAKYADDISKNQQEKYVHHHNLRSRDTEFSVGDEVVVLIPDSTNRLCSRWKGPGQIVERKSPHSFAVKLADGSIKHLHQNKLRKYIQPIRTVGVIYEADKEFGEVQHVPLQHRTNGGEGLNQLLETDDWNNLSLTQKSELFLIIRKFPSVFDGELRRARVGAHEIKLKPGIVRKQPHLYKVPESLKPKVEKQIAELLERDLIEPSTSEIVYPIVCVAKKDGTIRLCCDYRGLNAESQISPFPMQNSEELRFKAGAAKYLTTLDILKGYWEIPLEENSRELTSFVSSKGQYQWKVMPFGLSGAPATFQRVMNQILRPHSDFAESFLDDIIIYSSNWQDHLEHIRAILETLKECNFSANLGKCTFAKPKVKYLGHIVGSGAHGPDPEKIAVIKNLNPPRTKKALRSALGLFNYYREYVPYYADIAKPLTDLTRKSVSNDIPWSEEAEKAFKTLKDNLCSVTSLSTPDMSKPFELHTDASQTGIGACLMQREDENKPRPITFASQKLTAAQTKWSTIEREAFAIIWALGKFEVWTYGSFVSLYTDHNPLKYLTEGTPKNARLQRWSLALSRYQISISHKPGKSNTVADALSRLYEET